MSEAIPQVGLGILSWKGYDSLRLMLQNLQDSEVLALFKERLIFFPEIDDEARDIAARFGFSCKGSAENLGIAGGFRALAEALQSKTVLLLENDIQIIEPFAEAQRQLHCAAELLHSSQAHVVQMRHRTFPGQNIDSVGKYLKFFPKDTAPLSEQAMARLRRILNPFKAARVVNGAPYAVTNSENRHPRQITKDDCGFLHMSSATRRWTNQSIMIDRQFFLHTLMDFVDAAKTRRRVNGFKNIEIELNSVWWRKSGFKVAIAPGLFTHERVDFRGY